MVTSPVANFLYMQVKEKHCVPAAQYATTAFQLFSKLAMSVP